MIVMPSDEFFAWQIVRAGNVVLAADQGVRPNSLFATNTAAVADISAERDSDGALRRAKAFTFYKKWHRLFEVVERDPSYAVNLQEAYVDDGHVVLPRPELGDIRVPIDAENNFSLADFLGDKIPPGWPAKAKAFTEERIWHMGIVLAARALKLDLANADVDLVSGRIILRGPNGVQRTIPVDSQGFFYINWEIPYGDPRLAKEPVEELLMRDAARSNNQSAHLDNPWANKLVIIGSMATGNDLTDRGATPLSKESFLVSKHWNVASSIVTGRFVHRSSLGLDLLLIGLLGILTAVLTLRLRVLVASGTVLALMVGYTGLAFGLYVQQRYWLPVVLPLMSAMLLTHVALVTWRVLFEQAEQRRVKSIFSTVVSPKIMNELLTAKSLSLGGSRRQITVFFADVRGFTELTDTSQERTAEFVRANKLAGEAAEACFDEQARETLSTVNLYLGVVAETIVNKHDATLDKFIGDCVMAFWGAPTPNPRHAVRCVQAAIDAQRAVHELNLKRSAENKTRETENLARISAGLKPKPMLPILFLGSGINTGLATVGLMGSEIGAVVRQGNYTVFGREVNLASRLESLSGRGRIFISETTYEHLLRDDPALGATCIVLAPERVKGFRTPVKVYEVPWRPPGSPSLEVEFASDVTPDSSAATIFIDRGDAPDQRQ